MSEFSLTHYAFKLNVYVLLVKTHLLKIKIIFIWRFFFEQ